MNTCTGHRPQAHNASGGKGEGDAVWQLAMEMARRYCVKPEDVACSIALLQAPAPAGDAAALGQQSMLVVASSSASPDAAPRGSTRDSKRSTGQAAGGSGKQAGSSTRVDKESQPALFLALREPEVVETDGDICVALLNSDLTAFGVVQLKRADPEGLAQDSAVLRAIAEGAAAAYSEVEFRRKLALVLQAASADLSSTLPLELACASFPDLAGGHVMCASNCRARHGALAAVVPHQSLTPQVLRRPSDDVTDDSLL